MKTIDSEIIDKIVERIVDNTNPQKVILFGSYATDKYDIDSDIDLLILKEMDEPRHKRGRKIRKHLRGMEIPVDIIVLTPEEVEEYKNITNSLISNALKEGVVLYG
ncbi:MAG: nucleotidyltransferase domain-containing protein [Bacillota bacterium]